MARLNFNLRRQLIVVSLLLLTLPWAGCRFIQEMESTLSKAQAQALRSTAETLAAMASDRSELIYPDNGRMRTAADPRQALYAPLASQAVIIDGYAEGWEDTPSFSWHSTAAADNALRMRVQAVTRGGNLYLLARVTDSEVTYHNPGLSREPNGDRLVLRTWQKGRRQEYVLATAAPGQLTARPAGRRERGVDPERIWGYWQDAPGGYTIELEVPLALTGGRLGLYAIDARTGRSAPALTVGNIGPLDTQPPPWLVYTPKSLPIVLSPFAAQAGSVQVLDRERWIVGELSGSTKPAQTPATFWLLRLIYRSILSDNDLPYPPTAATAGKRAPAGDVGKTGTLSLRYRDPENANRTLRVIEAPVYAGQALIGSVVVSQSSEQYLSLTDHAFSRLLGYSALAIGLGVFGLLAYASLLSLRISRLSKAASEVIASDGSISGDFPQSRATDEIGELSRHYGELLNRLRDYNDYLRTLSSKLTHELRTPIAVIQTSLENLEETRVSDPQNERYLDRAREGLGRLTHILRDMSEASRLEESLSQNALQEIDLLPLLKELLPAYSAIYADSKITLTAAEEPAIILAAPDLVVQLLDKLVDNAVSFSLPGTPVLIALQDGASAWTLTVANSGPPLPETIQGALFEPMVSSRAGDDGALHLGLGLHIARLISDYLGAGISAVNTVDPTGVKISVAFPKVHRPQKRAS